MNIVVKLSFCRYFLKEVLPCQISSQSIMVLAYYQWHTGRRFEDIVKDGLTLSTVMSMYILHEADENKFVEAANEILSRNKARRKTRLYEIRKARGFTQQQLSDASGVTLRMIQLYEQRQQSAGECCNQSCQCAGLPRGRSAGIVEGLEASYVLADV